jgi:UDP-N-acetylglucosamine acyltransferase
MIHQTAVVDPRAEIDSNVFIGPYALIEGPVHISSGTEIQGHAVITGSVQIGMNNRIGYGAVIGALPQDLGFDPNARSGVEIGENNVIREYCTIHRGTKEGSNTLVGSNNLLMVGAHLGHNTRLGNHVILANNVLLGGYAEIHDRVFIGGGSVVHQFTRMGAISLMQGISGVGKDVPPFSIAIGKVGVSTINVVGLRRAPAPTGRLHCRNAQGSKRGIRALIPEWVEFKPESRGIDEAFLVERGFFVLGLCRDIKTRDLPHRSMEGDSRHGRKRRNGVTGVTA